MRPGDVLRYPVESAEGRLPQCAESVRFRARILQTSVDVLVLCDHVKSFDWKRTARGVRKAPNAILDDVRERLRPLIGL